MVHKLIDKFCWFISVFMVISLAIMVIMVFGNVVLRYGFNSGIAVSEELSRWLFVWVIFLGATVAVREHGHISTDMLVTKLPAPLQKACQVLGHILMLWVTWLMFSGSLTQTRINLDVEAPVTGFSMAWLYAAGLLFAVFTGFLLLLELWELLTHKAKRSAA